MPTALLEPGFELVHIISGYYDGILDGLADWQGRPHHFELESPGPANQPYDRYRLTPLSPEVFSAAIEGWDIWCRREQAHRAGQVADHLGPNPALPQDEERRQQIDKLVADWIASSKAASFVVDGEFRPLVADAFIGTARGVMQVRWITLHADA
jgi:hypothetical protein